MKKYADVQLVMLPGLGGDKRSFLHQSPLPCTHIPISYLDFANDITIPAYTKRLLDHLLHTEQIDLNRPIVLLGMSLGGALAEEMSKLLNVKAVLLLGTPRSAHELQPAIFFLGRDIASHLPLWVYQASLPIIPIVMRIASRISVEDVILSTEMYRTLSKMFFRNAYHALSLWNGCKINVPLFRLHGNDDHIIPLERTTGVDRVIIGAKHLVGMSHFTEVNREIEIFLDSILA